ncbi:hypothetical protein TRVL_07713 [Trypanosoma vivax]|nr:hypothetical protein TRVL_07713 [Trypanosoma vivax]
MHHNSGYNTMYDNMHMHTHNVQQVAMHGYGQGVGGNGWSGPPPPQVSMYNQNYGHMGPGGVAAGGGGGGYGDMGGMYPDMHNGQYSSPQSHMGGGAGVPYVRNAPMHGSVPPSGPHPGGYGGIPGQGGTPLAMGYGRGGQPPMDSMQQSSMYCGPMMRHEGYPDSRMSPTAQIAYGPGSAAPPMPGPPYGGVPASTGPGPGGSMPIPRPPGGGSGGYVDPSGRGMMNSPMSLPSAVRQPRIGTPDAGVVPLGRLNQSHPMMPHGMASSPNNYMAGMGRSPSSRVIASTPPPVVEPFRGEEDTGRPPTDTLYDFLQERGLVSIDNLSRFFPERYDMKNDPPLRIAVDGNFCLTSLRDELKKKDSLWFLHSTLPEELLRLVWHHVEWMRSLKLEPIWVFNGLSVSGDVETFLTTEAELRARDRVWCELEDGLIPSETEIQEAFDQPLGEDVQMAVARYLRHKLNVMVVTAPFLNWAQMVAFHKEEIADLLMGPPEMLLLPYDEMVVIVQIDVSNNNVSYLDRDKVLRALFPHHVTESSTKLAGDRLMDLGLITAMHPALSSARVNLELSMQEIYEELSALTPKYPSIKEFIGKHSRGQDSNKRGGLAIKHSKGRGYLRYSPVFSSKYTESPLVYLVRVLDPNLTNADMPANLVGVLGHNVPLSLFYLQFAGLLSVRIMTVITQSYLRDECPVSDTKDYHDKLDVLMTMRSQIIAQISRKIGQQSSLKQNECLSWVRWFQPILAPMDRPRDLINLDEWELKDNEEIKKLDENRLDDYSIASVLSFTTEAARPVNVDGSISPRNMPVMYHGKKETLYAILLKVFDFLGYFSHSTSPQDTLDEAGAEVEEGVLEYTGHEDNGDGQGQGRSSMTVGGGGGLAPPACFPGGAAVNEVGDRNSRVMASEYNGGSNVYFPTYLMATIKANPSSFQGPFVILTELIRVGIISSMPCRYINPANQQEAVPLEDQDDNCDARVLLASRIACLVTLPYHRSSEDLPFVWAPVYSRHLCAFTVMVRAMCRSLRELVEVIATTVFLTGNSDCGLEDFAKFSAILPFGDVPSTVGGLLLHYVLVFPSDYQNGLTTAQQRIEYLQGKFRDVPDLAKHLHIVMSFTLQALYLVNAYALTDREDIAPKDLLNGSTVAETIQMLWGKWRDHIDDHPPQDIHNLYTAGGCSS